jgi:16S rRNA (uracil1498-N3)-methyltransferase
VGLAVFHSADLGGDEVTLAGPEGRHAAVVRRVGQGERVRITDGRGAFVDGPVTAVSRSGITVAVEERSRVSAPQPRFVVVQALPKGERAELAVEMLTETGADLIVPWNAERSQFRLNPDRASRTVAKWRAWAFEASKQSRRTWFCEVADIASTDQIADLVRRAALPVVLHEEAKRPLAGVVPPTPGETVLVIGPEGGIAPAELDAFGHEPYRLGETVLRTSTAGIAALAVLQAASRWA